MHSLQTSSLATDASFSYETYASSHFALKRVLGILRPYRLRIAGIGLLLVAASAVGLAAPFLLRAIIDEALPQRDLQRLTVLVGGLVLVAVLSASLGAYQVMLSARIGQTILHDLRVRLYTHLQSMSLGFYTGTRAGEIQSRVASDIAALQSLVTNTASDLARSLSTVLMTAAAILFLDWRLALLMLLIVPVTLVVSHHVSQMREALTFEQQSRAADVSAAVQETLSISGVILARTTGRSAHLSQRFAALSRELSKMEIQAHTAGEWYWALITVALAVLPALTLLAGGLLMHVDAPTTIGTLVAMIALQEQLIWPFEQLLEIARDMRKTRAVFARIFEYLDKPAEVLERADPISLPRAEMRGEVSIENVGFSYHRDGAAAIRNVSIHVPAGYHLAIVGATGSGKSTLGSLIARLYDVNEGTIRFDGIDIRDLSFETMATMLGVVTQEPYLLHATIAENLRFAAPAASNADLIAAARIAQIHDRIMALPEGYDTLVGERGHRFSGGEKQRLALARTILKNPAILLLDEATSALDTQTEQAVSAALAEVSRGRTTITIAHRLSTVRRADEIVVLKDGRIAERGTHDELLAQEGHYAGLATALN